MNASGSFCKTASQSSEPQPAWRCQQGVTKMALTMSELRPDDPETVRVDGPARLGLDRDLLNVPQRIHAFAILVLPMAGTIGAGWHALRYGVGALEIGLLIAMYSVSWI